jgi:glycerate 2-kinase
MAPADSTTEREEGAASRLLREHAIAIWRAALAAADPTQLVRRNLQDPASPVAAALAVARRILVVGGGKAAGAMSAALEDFLPQCLGRIDGLVNVPVDCVRPLRRIQLHGARPAGINEPTLEGVEGSLRMLDLMSGAAPDDVALCVLSGGGSALLPAPPPGVALEDEQKLTRLLHACGATINEMNAVRKHLSRIKGGQLARSFRGRRLFGWIISDVIGDRLDVIASGPTAPDPTTFADALAVLERYRLLLQTPAAIVQHLRMGAAGEMPETPKKLPSHVRNYIIGNNRQALAGATAVAERLGYRVLNLGSFVDGETQDVAATFAAIVRSVRQHRLPLPPPLCLLSGGETTVTLSDDHGLGGRNQEFALAFLAKLGQEGMDRVLVLSAGTDGEDGPCDAAGAFADEQTLRICRQQGIDPHRFLARHDSYHFFDAVGGLMKTGLTETNVMDVRVILVQ